MQNINVQYFEQIIIQNIDLFLNHTANCLQSTAITNQLELPSVQFTNWEVLTALASALSKQNRNTSFQCLETLIWRDCNTTCWHAWRKQKVTWKCLRKYGSYMVIDGYIFMVYSQISIISFQSRLDYYSEGTCHTYITCLPIFHM